MNEDHLSETREGVEVPMWGPVVDRRFPPASSDIREFPTDEPLPPKGHPILAWIALVIMIGVQQASAFMADPADAREMLAEGGSLIGQIEGRLLVGMHQIGEDLGGEFKEGFQQEIETNLSPHQGPVIQRLQAVAIRGELSGPAEALASLNRINEAILDSDHQSNDVETRLLEISERAYRKIQAKEDPEQSLNQDEQKLITKKLGWCGQLMLSPAGIGPQSHRDAVIAPARRFAYLMLIGMVLLILGLICGLMLGLTLMFLFVTGLLPFGLRPRSRAGNAGASGVYLEAFAVWMGAFQIGSLVLTRLPIQNILIPALALNILTAMIIGIMWPVVRGIPWSVVSQDLGWHRGTGIFFEPWFGLLGYLATLPLLSIGILLMLQLAVIAGMLFPQEVITDPFAPLEVPMHPIVSWVAEGNRIVLLQVAFLACVLAPFVEETMFRGFLLRYLRDSSRWTGIGFSFLFSVLFNSFIFAAIHPQGPLAIPVLMAIACGLSILREWRGSLIGPMVAHGINNGVVTLILFGAVW